MVIYFFIAFLFLVFAQKNGRLVFLAMFSLLACLAVFRDTSVGADNVVYALNYRVIDFNQNTWSAFTEMEPGYNWLMASCKSILGFRYIDFMRLNAIVFLSGFFVFAAKKSVNPFLSLFFFYFLTIYTTSFNIMRQCFGLGIFLLVYSYFFYKEQFRLKEFVAFEFFVMLLSFNIQRSLIILLLVPLFNNKYINLFLMNRKKVQILLWMSFLLGGFSSVMASSIPIIAKYLSFLGDRYVGYIYTSVNSEKYSIYSSLMDTFIAAWICFSIKNEEHIRIPYAALIIGTAVANVFGGMSSLFLRVALNLTIFKIVLFPYVWNNNKYMKITKIIFLVYCLIIFVKAILKNFGKIVPYSFYGG
jgi:hypothetical protein